MNVILAVLLMLVQTLDFINESNVMNYFDLFKKNKKLILVLIAIVTGVAFLLSFVISNHYDKKLQLNDEDLSNTNLGVQDKDLENFKTVEFKLPYAPDILLPTVFTEGELKNIEKNMIHLKYDSNDFNPYTSVVTDPKVVKKGSNMEISYSGPPNAFLSYYIKELNRKYGSNMFNLKKVKYEQVSSNGFEPGVPLFEFEGLETIDRTFYILQFNNAPMGSKYGDAYYVVSFDTKNNKTTILMPNFFPSSFNSFLMKVPNVAQAVRPFLYEGYGASSVPIKYNVSYTRDNFELIDGSGFVSYYIDTDTLQVLPILSKKAKVVNLGVSTLEDLFVMGVFN